MGKLSPRVADDLKAFTKDGFDENATFLAAEQAKYKNLIKRLLAEQLDQPSDAFVQFVLHQVYSRPITEQVRANFFRFIRNGVREFVIEQAPWPDPGVCDTIPPPVSREPRGIDPESPPDLTHSKISRATIDGQVLEGANWNSVLRHMVAKGMQDPEHLAMIRSICGGGVIAGEQKDKGFRPVHRRGACVSVRYQPAKNALDYIAKIARTTNVSVCLDIAFPDGSTRRLEILK